MNRKIMVILLISLLCLTSACAGPKDTADDDFLSRLQFSADNPGSGFASPPGVSDILDEMYAKGSAIAFNIYDETGTPFSQTTVKYTGGRFEFILSLDIFRKEQYADELDMILFLMIDGYLQPYYLNDSRTAAEFTPMLLEASDETYYYKISFDPIYVPYGTKACVSLILSNSNHMFYTNPITVEGAGATEIVFGLTADQRANAIPYTKQENRINCQTDVHFAPGYGNDFFLAEKLTSPDQPGHASYFETDQPLFASCYLPGNWATEEGFFPCNDVRLYMVVNGKLVKAFNGSYYCDVDREFDTSYEVPLDMSIFPKNELCKAYIIIINMVAIADVCSKDFEDANVFHASSSLSYTLLVKA